MDGNNNNGGNNLDSWSIPKRKPAQPSQQNPPPPPMMNMAIPKKKKPPPQQGPPPNLNMTIPRRPSHVGGNPPPKKRPPSFDKSAIPRKGGGFGGNNWGNKPSSSYDNKAHSIPRRSSPSFDPAEALLAMHQAPIPRKQKQQPSQLPLRQPPSAASAAAPPRQPRGGPQVVSEFPFILRLPTRGVPMHEGIPRFRTSIRAPKRVRQNYKEVDEDDLRDFLIDSSSDDDDDDDGHKKKKKTKLKRVSKMSATTPTTTTTTSGASVLPSGAVDETITAAANPALVATTSLDAPPPGTLNTLWYSREVFLNVYVMEKIIAWKTRNVTSLEWVPESLPAEGGPPTPIPAVDTAAARKWSGMALTNPMIWADPKKRTEVSRLVPARCPIVATMACYAQESQQEGPRYCIKAMTENDREEVYLVKWRGRSHLHSSWERGSDIIKFDQSNNTARHKIRRFVQSQELAFGLEWKRVLEEERATAATIHAHGELQASPTTAETDTVEEEYYPPAHTEIERVLACDESEMDTILFAKQRGLNMKIEQERIQQKEAGTIRKWNSKEGLDELLKERRWDPEDNVRYVVKWKGLPFTEITWEYWRDIKRDAADEAEDFWLRQRPPDPERVARLVNKPHPHISEFRKIQESPVYGKSERVRPIANMGQASEDDEGGSGPGFSLRSYQLEGVNWLLFNWWNKRSCILADEMGLGKTIQSMCFLKSLQDLPTTDVRGPFLIVAPLSLIGQWQSEAKTWAPDLNVVLYHGSADARDFLVKQDFFYKDQFVPKPTAVKLKKQHVTKFHILITTYEVVLKDVAVFSKIKWRALIVDEAHRLKNSKSKLFEDLGTVPRDFCLLLTGTPLANATEELWALLHFADKKAFADKDDFLEKFGELTDVDQVNELHTILKPYLLRRVKEDVEKSLPPKEETILEVSLTPIQKKYYKAIYERNTAFLYKGTKPNNAPSLMNVMMELRKCCNHPFLVRGAEERILNDAANEITPENDTEGKPVPIDHFELFADQLVKSSGKMVLMHKLLPKLFSNGHKVLIFSQMVRVLDLLEELLKIKQYKYERLDGSTSSSSRASAVDRFCRKSCQRFVMLLSTRAGGLGLNLTAADVIVIFDSDWNPQNDLQAMARAHRIGQTRAVRVYRLLTAKTYEMHMFHSASMKLGLERAVLSQQRDQGEEGDPNKSRKSDREAQAKEIDTLLKKGAYDVFKEDDDAEAQKFMETDIDQLLESNAQTVTYGQKEKSSGGLGSFSKASFVTDTGDGEKDVDLDDPDFWKKTAGLEPPVETPEEIAQMLDDGVKRSRKQVQQFDPFADYAIIEQRKEDKKMQKIREEKEAIAKLRTEKRTKKLVEKERRRKEKKEMRGSLFGKDNAPVSRPKPEIKFKKKKKSVLPLPISKKPPKEDVVLEETLSKEPKLKKRKMSGERKRTMKRIQNEDPQFERLKQAWDVPQRNRAVSAFMRFGFQRFCKIRGEANFTSLPIQDIEVYFRSYFYQLSLQLVVSFLQMLKGDDAAFTFNEDNIKTFLKECLGIPGSKELDWLCDCVSNGMKYYSEIESQRRSFRLPRVFTEEGFLSDLRRGAALRALRRLFILSRVERIIDDSLDGILDELGYEQLGRRGCPTSNFTSMDADLKARLVSTEELLLGVSVHLKNVTLRPPVAWWDRSCDIALLVGTFVHGLGNYDAMLNDESLPFAFKIKQFAESDEACAAAQKSFSCAAKATSKVFHDALEAAKIKDQLQIQAAVAAAAAASSKREKDAVALREGGEAADAVSTAVHDTPADKLYEIEGDDSHFVTLPRLKKMVHESVLSRQSSVVPESQATALPQQAPSNDDVVVTEEKSGRRKGNTQQVLAMPDARILDYRLHYILSEVERKAYPEEGTDIEADSPIVSNKLWPSSEIVSINNSIKNRASLRVFGDAAERFEVMGIGIHGMQAGSTHRTLDDGSDYFIGSANYDLSQIAYGSDAPRYLRAIGVPMNMTRFAVSALVHADGHCVEGLLKAEKLRNMVDDEKRSPRNEMRNEEQSKTEGNAPKEENNVASSDATTPIEDFADKAKQTPESADLTNGHKKSPEALPVSPQKVASSIPTVFEGSSKLRGAVCAVLLYYGFPFKEEKQLKVSSALWQSIRANSVSSDDVPSECMFEAGRFVSLVKEFHDDSADLPDFDTIKQYVFDCLLPHCLRLCLMGNGPTTDNARGSKGEYETAFGISVYPEPTENLQCGLPDPCLPLEEHSVEALAVAYAILRRSQLMRSAMELAAGKLDTVKMDAVLRSSFMCKSMAGLPVWWCPWIHDIALLVHAATRGLFSIIKDRTSAGTAPLVFSQDSILKHIQSTFISEDSKLPRSFTHSSPDDSQKWIQHVAQEFPTVNVLERRLAFLCAKATEHLQDEEARYDNLPMFDHGAWPRN